MINAYQCLGIEPCLVISDDALGDAFRAAGKRAHPDAGGAEGEFAGLREAFEILVSPSRRMKHWLELRGITIEERGAIDDRLMELFTEVGSTAQKVDQIVRKRDEAKSALVRAMLEQELQLCREEVERTLAKVEASIVEACAVFPEYENQWEIDLQSASKIARNLSFLEKWRVGLRASFSRLA